MLKLQTADSSYCLLSYKKHLQKLYETARDGKDPNCTKCDKDGFVKHTNSEIFSARKNLVPIMCHCVSDEKSRINRKIEELETIIKKYNVVFNSLDKEMTLDIFANRFNNQKLVNSIKKYLELGSMNSLYLEGESGTGKTTMLKMLWQIYAINNIKALYMKASSFEDMPDGTFNAGTSKDEKRCISDFVPYWISSNCIKCNMCSFVCPHGVIRPFQLSDEEYNNAPDYVKERCIDKYIIGILPKVLFKSVSFLFEFVFKFNDLLLDEDQLFIKNDQPFIFLLKKYI